MPKDLPIFPAAPILFLFLLGLPGTCMTVEPNEPSPQAVLMELKRAVTFFVDNCSKQGGYVWRYGADLSLSEGEGKTGPTRAWVQPPGTPSVGDVLLDAYEATGDRQYLEWATQTGRALVGGQLQSGGWYYSIEFDPRKRMPIGYRDNPDFRLNRTKKNRTNITTLDDDTTQSSLRFMARLDKTLDFADAQIHEAVRFSLDALLIAQYPNGGWGQNWDRYPQPKSSEEFPIVAASYPASWPRKWQNDWRGVYFLNDDVTPDMLRLMLYANDIYGDERYLKSAKRTGDFLLLAQMPDPQPGWAQQYDERMRPVWDRKFEPPAVSGQESQFAIRGLLYLARHTGDMKYLQGVGRALDYLDASTLPDGRLARFYEVQTNRPLYFRRTGKQYDLTYADDDRLPTHYAFKVRSVTGGLRAEYTRLLRDPTQPVNRSTPSAVRLASQVRGIIDQLDKRGGWVEPGRLRSYPRTDTGGVINSQTFVTNVRTMCRYLQAMKD